jgi:hypothetical protein
VQQEDDEKWMGDTQTECTMRSRVLVPCQQTFVATNLICAPRIRISTGWDIYEETPFCATSSSQLMNKKPKATHAHGLTELSSVQADPSGSHRILARAWPRKVGAF